MVEATVKEGETHFGFWTPRAFRSLKTSEAVTATSRMHEDALFILSLDPEVERIRPPSATMPVDHPAFLPDFETVGADGAVSYVHVLPADAEPAAKAALLDAVSAAAGAGVRYRVLSEAWVEREPRRRNARLVFGCRRTRVSPGDRVRVLHHMDENGPCTLLDAARAVTSSPDAVECVLALVTEGSLSIPLDVELGPETEVSRVATVPA